MSEDGPWLSDKGEWFFNAYAWPQSGAGSDSWGRYAYGFKEAGDRLVSGILNGQRGSLDLLLMPILHLYRHYIELSIKASILDLQRHLGVQESVGFTHSLDRWRHMFVLAGKVAGMHPPPFPQADRLVAEMKDHDPGGDAFRYPELRGGQPSTPNLAYVNIERLADGIACVEQAINWVEGVLGWAQDNAP